MVTVEIQLKAYRLMRAAVEMAAIYEKNRAICKYVHSTSRGHEAIQLATAFQLQPCDWISPYYRDESILLGMGFEPYQLMLQLLAKGEDIFTGGREYYAHPNYRGADRPNMLHQSSATGMQVIPATGLAQGLEYLSLIGSPLLVRGAADEAPVVVCSLGDARSFVGVTHFSDDRGNRARRRPSGPRLPAWARGRAPRRSAGGRPGSRPRIALRPRRG